MVKGKLQTKVFITYLIMIFLVSGAFSVFFYRYTSEILIERERKSAQDLNDTFIASTDQILKDMDTVCINIGYSNLIRDVFDDSSGLKVASKEFNDLSYLLTSINGADLKVHQINLYSYHGDLIQVGIKSNLTKIDLASYSWLETVQNNGGQKTITMPYQSTAYSSTNSAISPQWYISLYRCCTNQHKKETGIIETVQKCSIIFKNIIKYQKQNKNAVSIYIYNETGELVYPYNIEPEEAASIPGYYQAATSADTGSSYMNTVTDTKELLVTGTSAYNGWTYVTAQPEQNILVPVQNLLKLLFIIIVVITLVCAAISYRFSASLVRPIKQLHKVIKDTQLNTLNTQKSTAIQTSVNELDELNQAFAQMSADLKTSMNTLIETQKQELKSRSLALQSQINPHFYYNTLSGIIVLAENAQTDEVIIMCRNLTKIMRYITKNDTSPAALADEIEYIQHYLYCMKVRYQSSLSYTIDIDPAILTETVPKLIIQPLVENALKYGLADSPPWQITLTSTVTGDSWTITVTDSGNGFSPERMDVIAQRIHIANTGTGMPEMQIDGMGLLNVYLRWKLYCGEQMIFQYGNTPDGHGQVIIGKFIKER